MQTSILHFYPMVVNCKETLRDSVATILVLTSNVRAFLRTGNVRPLQPLILDAGVNDTSEQDNTVLGQNGSGQNGTDKMVSTKWYTDKMSLDKMVWTKWYGQNGTNKTVPIKSSINLLTPLPLTI